MDNIIRFIDDNGTLLPLEEIQKTVEEVYNDFSKEQFCDCGCSANPLVEPTSILSAIVNPDANINIEDATNTLAFLERSLYLTDVIKPESAISYADMIKFWNIIDETDEVPVEEREPIKIYIDSPGGDLDATFSIIDAITLSKTPVWTITIGNGCSGAFFIGIAGHKRFGFPHSSYLFHEGCAENGGDAHKFIQGVKFYEHRLSMLKQHTLKYTKITEEEYKKHKKDDLWMTAEEAVRYGVIDEILEEIL